MERVVQIKSVPAGTVNPCKCGSDDIVLIQHSNSMWTMGCKDCGHDLGKEIKTQEEAFCLWNKTMKSKKAATRAKNKYNAANYDRINLAIPRGQKDKIKECADLLCDSVNGFIMKAIEEKMASMKKGLE